MRRRVVKQRPAPTRAPHLDEVTGALARAVSVLRPRVPDTLARLGVYEGLAPEVLFPPPRRVPTVTLRQRWRLPGLVSEELRFASLHEPLEPAFRRHYHARRRRIHTVTARRIRPDGVGARPRLLYIHGYMQPETVLEELVLLATMARVLDMEVVQIQPPYHGSRKPRRSLFDGELFWTADLVRSVESVRQTVLDARTLLGWMRRRARTPVGVSGLSLGGALAATLTCVEPGFAFSAPLIAHMDLARFGWSVDDFAAFTDRLGWRALRPVLPRERIHLFAASDDRFFRPEVVEAMWRRWRRPRIQWYPCSHMGFLAHLPDAVRRLRAFVDALELEPEPPRRGAR